MLQLLFSIYSCPSLKSIAGAQVDI